MKFIFAALLLCIGGLDDCFGNKDNANSWKVVRDRGTNSCVAIKITAMDPGRPDQLGTYRDEQSANAAIVTFKAQPDPNKAGFEMCM